MTGYSTTNRIAAQGRLDSQCDIGQSSWPAKAGLLGLLWAPALEVAARGVTVKVAVDEVPPRAGRFKAEELR
jgi:hypothetical protein